MNKKNLVQNDERSPEELREMGKKGGVRSGEARRRNKRMREVATALAVIFMESAEGKELLSELKKKLKD